MITQEIIAYIRQQLKAGITKDSIRGALAAAGWQIQDIAGAFAVIESDDPSAAVMIPSAEQVQSPDFIQPIPRPRNRRTWLIVSSFLISGVIIVAAIAYYYGLFASVPSISVVKTPAASSTTPSQVEENLVGATSTVQ